MPGDFIPISGKEETLLFDQTQAAACHRVVKNISSNDPVRKPGHFLPRRKSGCPSPAAEFRIAAVGGNVSVGPHYRFLSEVPKRGAVPGFPGDGPGAPLLNADNGDYHNYDYQLFYESIRENAVGRVNAYLKKSGKII